jgi:hypothetical protein
MITEDKPMTIRISLIGDHGGELAAHDLYVDGEDNFDATLSNAISHLVLHTWTLAPGDTIKIAEVD